MSYICVATRTATQERRRRARGGAVPVWTRSIRSHGDGGAVRVRDRGGGGAARARSRDSGGLRGELRKSNNDKPPVCNLSRTIIKSLA